MESLAARCLIFEVLLSGQKVVKEQRVVYSRFCRTFCLCFSGWLSTLLKRSRLYINYLASLICLNILSQTFLEINKILRSLLTIHKFLLRIEHICGTVGHRVQRLMGWRWFCQLFLVRSWRGPYNPWNFNAISHIDYQLIWRTHGSQLLVQLVGLLLKRKFTSLTSQICKALCGFASTHLRKTVSHLRILAQKFFIFVNLRSLWVEEGAERLHHIWSFWVTNFIIFLFCASLSHNLRVSSK